MNNDTNSPLATVPDYAAKDNWARYLYGRNRGHDEYCAQAKLLEGMYLGGGLQWSEEDRQALLDQGRVLHEFNEIAPAVNAAIGYQIHNRMDIAFKPRAGDADEELAAVRSKIAMQIADNQMLHWKETDVFTDGLIEQRGYFDVRIDYSDSVLGELAVDVIDPRDVIPDPDAKSYDTESWSDVIITRWLTLDAIEQQFGLELRQKVEAARPTEADFGTDDISGERSRFGDNRNLGGWSEYDAWRVDAGLVRVRVVDRQKHVWADRNVVIYPTGDIRPIAEDKIDQAIQSGAIVTKRKIQIVHRVISTRDYVLYEGDSELPFFSIVPYFPYFRRGKTRGLVDNGVSPQQAYNKLISQYIHVINSTANSGWVVQENSLTNMDTDELADVGAVTGLVIEYKENKQPPQKIQPNQVPTGVDKMIERTMGATRDATIPEAMRGNQGQEVSGVAIQSKQFASQQQLAIVLDNLSRTRHSLAKKIDWAITHIYDSARVFRIIGTDQETGRKKTEEVAINQPMPDGNYYNDMTIGEYDVIISEQPMQVTFENSQFTQALEMREKGVRIDDKIILRYSNLADKHDIIEQMAKDQMQQAPVNPLDEAKAALLQAQAEQVKANAKKLSAEETESIIRSMFSAMQAAGLAVTDSRIAIAGDGLYKAAGGVDYDGAPLINPQSAGSTAIPQMPVNTSPGFPALPDDGVVDSENQSIQMPDSPVNGVNAGIETQRNEPI